MIMVYFGPEMEEVDEDDLHEVIADLAPLAARGCSHVTLLTESLQPGLGRATKAALGAAFGAGLTGLEVQLMHATPVAPSFWSRLWRHQPHLSHLKITEWSSGDNDGEEYDARLDALADFMGCYSGPPLSQHQVH